MTTPTGVITMADVRTEIGASGVITLNDTNVRTLAGKASGIITMNDLRGKTWATVQLAGGSASRISTSPGDAYAGFQFNTDGTISRCQATTLSWTAGFANYRTPTLAGVGSSYWIKATVSAGSTPTSGAIGSWMQLNSVRSWHNALTANAAAMKTTTLSIQLSTDNAGGTIVATGSYTFEVEVSL